MADQQVHKQGPTYPTAVVGPGVMPDASPYTVDIDGRRFNKHGEPYCVTCGNSTNKSYANHPYLTCWACGSVIWHVRKEVSTVNAIQHGGDHYKSKAIQPWDYITSNNLGYLEGNVVKYVSRYKDKGGVEDLKKARHYLDKLIEVTEATAVPTTAREA